MIVLPYQGDYVVYFNEWTPILKGIVGKFDGWEPTSYDLKITPQGKGYKKGWWIDRYNYLILLKRMDNSILLI